MKLNGIKYDTIIALEVLEHIPDGLIIAQKLKPYCSKLLITMPYNEPKGYWGEYHVLHRIKESDLPDFNITYLYDNGTIAEKPSGLKTDLMLAVWKDKTFSSGDIL